MLGEGDRRTERVFVSRSLWEVSGAVQSWCLTARCLPLLLLLIHRHAAGSERDHQQQAADDRGGLEEVVLEEIVHGLVGGDGPEGVKVDVDDQEPQDQGQRCQLGFETDGDQDDEGGPDQVLQDLWGNRNRMSTWPTGTFTPLKKSQEQSKGDSAVSPALTKMLLTCI